MKFFLLGHHWVNAGPSNVNRSLINNSDGDMVYTKSKSKLGFYLESAYYTFKYNQILLSGSNSWKIESLLKLFNKRYYYLMHGCVEYENIINNLHVSQKDLDAEQKILKQAIKIICVSEGYAKWVKNRYPQFENKITFVNNGINIEPRPKVEKRPLSIAVAGGNRCIKNNGEVYRAVKKLNAENIPCKLYVFGRFYPDNDEFIKNNDVIHYGQLDRDEYYKKLDQIDCFIMNSEVEPFGLVVADALNCNCSLLMSKNVGSRYIMKTDPNDIIQNPHNIEELAEKIKRVLNYPNGERLFQTIDVKACSEQQAYQNIKKIIEK